MFARLLILFIAVPFVELVLLLRMAEATSWLTTLAIVVVTGLIGSFLARREGIAAFRRFRQALSENRVPGQEIQDGLMIAFAAALLLTPGLLTDALGFTLLTPPGRKWIGGFLRRRYGGLFQVQTSGPQVRSGGFGQNVPDGTGRPSQPGGTGNPNSAGGSYTIDSPSFGPKAKA